MNLFPITFETIYAAVGEAISTWAQVEEALAILFAMSVSGTDPGRFDSGSAHLRAAKRAFRAIQAFDSKLKMTNEAAASIFGGTKRRSAHRRSNNDTCCNRAMALGKMEASSETKNGSTEKIAILHQMR